MTSPQNTPSLSVVIPAYNEEKMISKSMTTLLKTLAEFANDFEVIVVDDGSTDATVKILAGIAASDPRLFCLKNGANKGLGFSLRRGFEAARKELIFYCDADMPIDYLMIRDCVLAMQEKKLDLIFGFRKNRGGEPVYRTIYSLAYNRLISFLFGIPVKDVNFSLKLFKRSLLNDLALRSEGSFIDAEMVVKAAYAGYKFEQIGAQYFPRTAGVSHLATPRVILGIIRELHKYRKEILASRSRKLIINADDLGLHKEINSAIETCIEKGVARSVSCVTNTAAFDDALRTIKQHPHVSVGIHLNLSDGAPLSTGMGFILDKGGTFPGDHLTTAWRLIKHPFSRKNIEEEFEAQIRKLTDAGIKISHIDSHGYIHLLPPLFDITIKLAHKFDIPFIRIPRVKALCAKNAFSPKLFTIRALAGLARIRLGKKLRSADQLYGLEYAGRLDEQLIVSMIRKIKPGLAELAVHPGSSNAVLDNAYAWGYNWERELLSLIDPEVEKAIKEQHVTLTGFDET